MASDPTSPAPPDPATPDPGSTDAATPGSGPPPTVAASAVTAGAVVGLLVIACTATARALLDRIVGDGDDQIVALALFVVLLVGYGAAGWTAQRRAEAVGVPGAPLTHGSLAGLGAFVAWIPIRILIWVARGEDRGLVTGNDAALRPGQVFGALVIAAGLGLVGAFLATRRWWRAPRPTPPDPA